MNSSDSTNTVAVSDASGEATGSSTAGFADLEQLETQIKQRLERVIVRARAVSKSAKHLLQQRRTLAELQKSGEDLVEGRNQHLEEIIDQERRLREERLTKIRAHRSDLERIIELRELTMDAREESWRRYQAVYAEGSAAWFRKLADLNTDYAQRLAEVRAWLTEVERRWLPSETSPGA